MINIILLYHYYNSTMSIYSSIYIPRMSIDYNENSIRNIMEYYRIGTVEYVDFTPINKKPGFGENVDQVVKSAFVHFYNRRDARDERNNDFWNAIAEGEPYKLQVSPREYWICLKNKNPIQRTFMNIHQIVENGRYLENLVYHQQKKIEELEKFVKDPEYQDILLIIRKQAKTHAMNMERNIVENNERIGILESKLQGLIDDLDSYDILRYR